MPNCWLRILLYLYFCVPSSRCCKLEAHIRAMFSPQSAKSFKFITFISQEISPKNVDFQLLLKNGQILAIEESASYSARVTNYLYKLISKVLKE